MRTLDAGRIGLISDTHGLMRPAAIEFLRGCDLIIHGGDIGGPEVLDQLAALAPVLAVRGNNDTDAWTTRLPVSDSFRVHGIGVHVVHDRRSLAMAPLDAEITVVICGHSHRPSIETCAGVLHVNPGSAGRRRFHLPVTVGELRRVDDRLQPRIVALV